MGLLDALGSGEGGLFGSSWDDPRTQAVLSMAAGLMRGNPVGQNRANFGQSLSQGLLGYMQGRQSGQEMQMKRKLLDSQVQENEAQAAQKKAALENARMLRDKQARWSGGPQSGIGAITQAAELGRPGPNMTAAALMSNAAPQGPRPPTLMEALDYYVSGGKDLREYAKDAATGYPLQQGTTYINPVTGLERYMPKVGDGIMSGPNGQAFEMPGYAQANANIEATKAGAVRRKEQEAQLPFDLQRFNAQAGLDTVNVPGPVAGQQGVTTRLNIAQNVGTAPQLPGQSPQGAAPGQWAQINQQYAAGAGARDSGRAAVLRDELMRETDPRNRQALEFELRRVNGGGQPQAPQPQTPQQQRPGVMTFGQPAADAAFATETQKGQAEQLLKSRESASNARDSIYTTQQARDLLKTNPITGTGADLRLSIAKFAKTAFGVEIDPNKVANSEYLRSVLGGRVLDQAKALGANPSNTDRDFIQQIVGTLGTDPNAMQKILDFQEHMAWRGLDSYNRQVSEAMQRNPGAYTTDPRISFGAIRPLPPKQFTRDLNAGSQYRLPDGRVGIWNGQGFEVQ